MKQRNILIASVFILQACATTPHATKVDVRDVASLDNNGDGIDDSFDENLEQYYLGDATKELDAKNKVAAVIADFIQTQKQRRQEVYASPDKDLPRSGRVFNDLPVYDYATRDVHRKTNGCYKAEINFVNELYSSINQQTETYLKETPSLPLSMLSGPDQLGVFANGMSYDAIVRLSNGNPGNRRDVMPDARGFAVKILPKGTLKDETLAIQDARELNYKTKLDILTINFPTFFMNDPIKYAALNQKALFGDADFKNALVSKADEFISVVKSAEISSLQEALTFQVNGSIIYSPLFQNYYSMVPSRLGPIGQIRAVKYSWQPVACSQDAEVSAQFAVESQKQFPTWVNDHSYAFPPHTPASVTSSANKADFPDDYLRVHAAERLAKSDFCFDLFFQLYRDPVSTNIEDSTDLWLARETDRDWWINKIIPSKILWYASHNNTESREEYVQKFMQKKLAPPLLAAHLTIKKLEGEDLNYAGQNSKTCEDLSFNPWNGDIAHHKPLGIISRIKRKVYNASRRTRHELNGIKDDSSIERPN